MFTKKMLDRKAKTILNFFGKTGGSIKIEDRIYNGFFEAISYTKNYRDYGRVDSYAQTFVGMASDFDVIPAVKTVVDVDGTQLKIGNVNIDPTCNIIRMDLIPILG